VSLFVDLRRIYYVYIQSAVENTMNIANMKILAKNTDAVSVFFKMHFSYIELMAELWISIIRKT
jgi:hypothetical protein